MRTDTDTYFHGYWINKGYFEAYGDVFTKEFTFPALTEPHNKRYAKEIQNTLSVAFHVRRGDYVKLNYELPSEFYVQQVETVLKAYPQAVFFVFSDEPDYCREHAHELGFDRAVRTVFVEGNDNGNNYRDLQLMSMCKGIVLSSSAFCFLAGVLNRKKKFWTDYINREL